MGSEWKSTTLGDVSTQVDYGYTASATSVNTGSRLLRITDIQDGVVDWRQVPYCEIDGASRGKYLLHQGDIVVARTGNSTGENFLYQGGEEAVFASYLIRFRVDVSLVDPGYVWRCMRSSSWWNFIDGSKTGSAQAGANAKVLGLFEFEYPPLPEQKAIAHILGTLDDKIELNRKTNKTLEAMAKTLFKSWFVDFDPVRAKAEGRPTGLPAEISDIFPDSFEDSELGEIPSGWQVSSLGEVIELAYGKPLKEEQRKGGSYPVFGSNGVVGSHDEYLVEAPGIVVGRKGNPGTVEWSGKNFYPIDTTFFVVNKKSGLGMRFLFYCLRNQNLGDLSADSAVPGLNRNHAYMNNQLLPPIEVTSAFERHLEVIFKRKEFLADEINALSETRDVLLPKLISGEIRIPDAEKMLEEVGS
jgi:type I restriction enzyme, S subunit